MKKIHFIFAAILCLVYTMSSSAQDDTRTWGVSASIQENQFDILFPIWTGVNNVIAPSIGAMYIEDSGTDLRLGLLDRIYFNATKTIKPFLGLRAGILLSLPKGNDNATDYIIGLLGGGEYFFSKNFSVGVEAQLNMSISDDNSSRFGNPGGINVNTATAIFATIFF